MKIPCCGGPRLPAALLAVSFLPLFAGIYVAWDVQRSVQQASEALALNVRSIRAAEELAIGIRDVRTRLDRFLHSGDGDALAEIPRLHAEMDRWLGEAHRAAVTPREQELIACLRRGYGRFFDEVARLGQGPPEGHPAAARTLIPRVGEILGPAQEYLDYNEEEIQRGSEVNQRTAGRLAVALLLLGVCGPVSGLLAGYGVARSFSRRVVRLSVPVRDAAGKLNEVVGPVTVSAGASLEELEAALRRMADQIGAVVERLQQSQREALRAEQLAAVGQLAAGFAHELRNPLMSMKILVQSAAERGHGAALTGRALAVLEEEVTRLEQLTATFLDFARPPHPEKRAFDARALLEDTADLVASRAGQRDVRIECDLPPVPVWVEADLGQLRQVVLNLMLNALEAVPDGGVVRVQVASDGLPPYTSSARAGRGQQGPTGGWVTIRVADTGPGLPAELGQDIFAPFVSTKPTGLGLGLSICKRIAEDHGGDVTAANGPGGGAVFSVRLPPSHRPANATLPAA